MYLDMALTQLGWWQLAVDSFCHSVSANSVSGLHIKVPTSSTGSTDVQK